MRRPTALRGWLAAYAAATATTATYNTILDAATSVESDKPSKSTTIRYRDVLSQLWMLDPVPGWLLGHGRIARLAQAPNINLADPALAAFLLDVDEDGLLAGRGAARPIPRDGTLLGGLFESLAALSVRTYAQANEARVSHLRTHDGRQEVDFIMEGSGPSTVAIEVKLGAVPGERNIRHLKWLGERLGPELTDAVVLTTGAEAYRRPDGIAVIPLALLGP